LEASGEVLTDVDDFPALPADDDDDDDACCTAALVVTSSPTAGRSTRNRIVFQTLNASARRSIHVHSPYFLPDRSATAELVGAAQEPGYALERFAGRGGPAPDHRPQCFKQCQGDLALIES
jgi:cardiolipin synthase